MPPPPADGSFGRDKATRVNAQLADKVTRRTLLGLRYDQTLAEKTVLLLKDLEQELLAALARINPTGVATRSAKIERQRRLLAEIQPEIGRQFRRIAALNQKELFSLAEIETAATRAIIVDSAATVGVELGVRLPPQNVFAKLFDAITVQSYPLRDWWNGQSVALFRSFSDAVGRGVVAGETTDQIARRVAGDKWGDLRNVPDEQAGDVIRKARRGARTLVRTSVASVQGEARQSVYESNLDVIEFFQHLSRLDSRTSDICIARAGKKWDAETKVPVGHELPFQVPPLHPNCRSNMIPIVYGGGQMAKNLGADEWLKGLSAQELQAVLGKGRARLFRTGRFKAADLINKSGDSLTLEELAQH